MCRPFDEVALPGNGSVNGSSENLQTAENCGSSSDIGFWSPIASMATVARQQRLTVNYNATGGMQSHLGLMRVS